MCKYYDVIIIGTGIAGMFTALNIDRNLDVLMITKSSSEDGNSVLAQGGIVSCINPKVHFEDTMKAGSFYNNEEAIRVVSDRSKVNIEKLIEYGVQFDRDEEGNFKFAREGGHRESTILYSKDITGKEIIRVLNNEVSKRYNIEIIENTQVIELLKKDEIINGVISLDENNQVKRYSSKSIVIATGGIGSIYKNTTNAPEMTGDGIALAYEAGANVKDMEFVQFHPTAVYGDNYERRFLISEAVRGEGAVLRNIHGEKFMYKYHEMMDLAPRDIVSRSIFKEMKDTQSDFVYLDITHKDPEITKERFPNIYNYCLKIGVDMTTEYIRVAPAEHYIMGGIETDLDGRTNVEGLYACGECACTGVHGANRLASNSLLEGIVFGERVSASINDKLSIIREVNKQEFKAFKNIELKCYRNKYLKQEFIDIENKLRDTMTSDASIVRKEKNILDALNIIDTLECNLKNNKSLEKKYFELKNMLIVSRLVMKAALRRTESIGSHFIVRMIGVK